MKSKEIISLLSHLDPDMPLDGVKITKKGITPYLNEKHAYTALAAFWGAFVGVLTFCALLALLAKVFPNL